MTEEIPKGWKKERLKLLISENVKSPYKVEDASNFGKYPFFTSGTSVLKFDNFIVNKENIFLSTGGNAQISYYNGKAAYSTDTYSLKSNINTKVLFYFILKNIDLINFKYFAGSGLKHLQKTDFKENFKVSYPESIQEQSKIAEILTKVDDAIEQTEQIIAKHERIKTGLMQDLFTKGIDENGNIRSEETHKFKDSLIGRIPEEWGIGRFSFYVDFQGGFAFSSKFLSNQGIKWLKIANVSFEGTKWEEIEYLPNNFLELYPNFSLKEGDLVVALTRPIIRHQLKICKLEKSDVPALLNQRVARIFSKNNSNLDFILNFMKSKFFVYKVESVILGTDPPNISTNQMSDFIVPIISDKEQLRITKVIDQNNRTLKKYNSELSKLKQIKEGLMQDLLTGKVRVNHLIEQEAVA